MSQRPKCPHCDQSVPHVIVAGSDLEYGSHMVGDLAFVVPISVLGEVGQASLENGDEQKETYIENIGGDLWYEAISRYVADVGEYLYCGLCNQQFDWCDEDEEEDDKDEPGDDTTVSAEDREEFIAKWGKPDTQQRDALMLDPEVEWTECPQCKDETDEKVWNACKVCDGYLWIPKMKNTREVIERHPLTTEVTLEEAFTIDPGPSKMSSFPQSGDPFDEGYYI